MDTVIVLTALIAKYTASVKGFMTRIVNIEKEHNNLQLDITRKLKETKNLWARIEYVKAYLVKMPKGTPAYRESSGALTELERRETILLNERNTLVLEMLPFLSKLDSAKKSLRTSEMNLAKCKKERSAAEEAARKMQIAMEVKRLAKEKAARKTAKHIKNRAFHRAQKEAKQVARENMKNISLKNETVPEEFYLLANKLGADITVDDDRETVLALLEDTRVTA